jgi:ATP-dependent Lhr-like helicase
MLETARTLIVDEIHAVVGDKRGSHLALSIERLEQLVRSNNASLTRIGLSATQRPIEEVARFLVGTENLDTSNKPNCAIIDSGHVRKLDLAIELPESPLSAVMSGEVWEEVYNRLTQLIRQHHTTLVFVNTRDWPSESRDISVSASAKRISLRIMAVSRASIVCRLSSD